MTHWLLLLAFVMPGADNALPRGALARGRLLASATVHFTHDGRHLLGAYFEGGFVILPANPAEIGDSDRHRDMPAEGAVSANVRWLATRKDRRTIVVGELPTLRYPPHVASDGLPVGVSDDGATVLVQSGVQFTEVSRSSGEVQMTYDCPDGKAEVVGWHPGASLIIKHGRASSVPESLSPTLMSLGSPKMPFALPPKEDRDRIQAAAIAHNRFTIALAYGRARHDTDILLFDLRTGKLLRRLHRRNFGVDYCLAFDSNDKLLAASGSVYPGGQDVPDIQGGIRFYDVTSGIQRGELVFGDETISSIRFSPDGTKCVTASALGEVIVWDSSTLIAPQ